MPNIFLATWANTIIKYICSLHHGRIWIFNIYNPHIWWLPIPHKLSFVALFILKPMKFPFPSGKGVRKKMSLWKDFTEYEYRMYSYPGCLPNANTEYIWSSQYDLIWMDSEMDTIILVIILSGLSSARLASRFPYWPLPDPDNPWESSLANFGPHRSSQSMTSSVSSQLGHFKAILDHFSSVWI